MFPVCYDSRLLASMSMRQGNHVMVGWFDPKGMDKGNSQWVRSTPLIKFELYDLSLDSSQSYELSKTRPEVFTELQAQMTTLWKDIQSDAPDWPAIKLK